MLLDVSEPCSLTLKQTKVSQRNKIEKSSRALEQVQMKGNVRICSAAVFPLLWIGAYFYCCCCQTGSMDGGAARYLRFRSLKRRRSNRGCVAQASHTSSRNHQGYKRAHSSRFVQRINVQASEPSLASPRESTSERICDPVSAVTCCQASSKKSTSFVWCPQKGIT